MATSAEIGLAALGAFAASEATGVTNVTQLGAQADDSGDSGGGAASPGLGALASQLGGLQGQIAGLGAAVNRPSGGGLSQTDLAAAFEQAVGSVNVASPNDTVSDNVTKVVETVTNPGGGDDRNLGGAGSTPTNPFGVLGGRLGGFDPDAAGEAIGEGAGDLVEGAVTETGEGIGYSIGNIPFALVGGAIDAGSDAGNRSRKWLEDVTGVEPQDTGLNKDAPGIGLTDLAAAGVGSAREYEQNNPKSLAERAQDYLSANSMDDLITGGSAADVGGTGAGSTGSGGSGSTGSGSASSETFGRSATPDEVKSAPTADEKDRENRDLDLSSRTGAIRL